MVTQTISRQLSEHFYMLLLTDFLTFSTDTAFLVIAEVGAHLVADRTGTIIVPSDASIMEGSEVTDDETSRHTLAGTHASTTI